MAKISGPVIDSFIFQLIFWILLFAKTWREEFARILILWWRELVPKWALENDSNLLEPGPFWVMWSNNPNWIAHHDQFPILLPPPWNRRSLRDSFSYVFLVEIQDRSSYIEAWCLQRASRITFRRGMNATAPRSRPISEFRQTTVPPNPKEENNI